MAFKTGLIIGAAAGYVLGAKAGRQRYDQIMSMVRRTAETEPVQKATAVAKDAAEGVADIAKQKVADGLDAAADKVENLTERFDT